MSDFDTIVQDMLDEDPTFLDEEPCYMNLETFCNIIALKSPTQPHDFDVIFMRNNTNMARLIAGTFGCATIVSPNRHTCEVTIPAHYRSARVHRMPTIWFVSEGYNDYDHIQSSIDFLRSDASCLKNLSIKEARINLVSVSPYTQTTVGIYKNYWRFK